MKIRAALFRRAGEPMSIESVDIDVPVGREVLVRVVACGICHSDAHFLDGKMSLGLVGAKSDAAVLGHEPAGIVEAVGPEVTYVKPGDRVVGCLSGFCGNCAQCFTGNPVRCLDKGAIVRRPVKRPRLSLDGKRILQLGMLGGFAEKMLVHENSIVKIDDGIALDYAALLGCGVLTGVGAVLNTAKVAPASTVAVFGCGGVGLSIVQGARIAGARALIAIDVRKEKLDMARRLGATHAIDASAGDAVQAIRAIVPQGVDYAFEAVGEPSLVPQLVQCVANGGSAVVVGVMPTGAQYAIPASAFHQEKSLKACSLGSSRFRTDIPLLIELYAGGKLDLAAMVSRRFPLEAINEGFDELHKGGLARGVVVFEQ